MKQQVNHLKERLIEEWQHFDQRIINREFMQPVAIENDCV